MRTIAASLLLCSMATTAHSYTLGRERDAEILSLGRVQSPQTDLCLEPPPQRLNGGTPAYQIGTPRGHQWWPVPITTRVPSPLIAQHRRGT